MEHVKTTVENPFDFSDVEIDIAVLPMVRALWSMNIKTYMSCENWRETNRRWIVTSDPWDAIFIARWFDKTTAASHRWLNIRITNQDGNSSSMTAICWEPYCDDVVLKTLHRLSDAIKANTELQ